MTTLFAQAITFILQSVGGFLTSLLLIRFFMQVFRVPFGNALGAFVLQLTNWAVLPLRKIIPSAGGLDVATLVAAYLVEIVIVTLTISLLGGMSGMLAGGPGLALVVLWHALRALLRAAIYLIIGVLIVQAILSWVSPYAPAYRLLTPITDVILRPIRRIVPLVANVDISPLIAIIVAQVLLIFV